MDRSNPLKRPATMVNSDRRSAPAGNFGRRTPFTYDSSDFNINERRINSERLSSIIARSNRPNLLPSLHSDEFEETEQVAGAISNGERDYASHHTELVGGDDLEEVPNNGKTNLKWNTIMDDVLIDALLAQMLKGQKIGTSFTSTAYKVVAKAVSVKFKVNCQSSHVVNRLKTIKQNYAVIHDMMACASGFGFNHSSQMIENEESVWDDYVKARPKAAKYRHMPVRNYSKLLNLFGKDRATGSHAAGPKQRRSRSYKEVNPNNENLDDSSSYEFEFDTNSTSHGATPTEAEAEAEAEAEHNGNTNSASKHYSKSKKRKSRISDILREEFISIRGGLDNVAASLDRGNIRNYDDDHLYNEIEKIDGMSEIVVMKVYQALSADVIRARAFLSCRNDRRKLWLLVRFGRSVLEDENIDEAFDLNNVGSST